MHFAFVTVPTYGHVNPSLPLVAELVRRGHHVSYATGQAMHEQVRAAGAEPVAIPFDVPEAPPAGGAKPDPATVARRSAWFLDSVRQVLPALCGRYETDRPDVFCGDLVSPVSLFAARKLDVRFVTMFSTHARNARFSVRHRKPAGPASAAQDEFQARLRELAAAHGVPNDIDLPGYVADLNLVFIPAEFQLAADTFDDRFVFLGPSIGPRAEAAGWRAPGDPLLYISLGTVFNARADFFRTCLDAFGGTDWRVAMAIGRRIDRSELGPIPANFLVEPWFPQLEVLRTATAFVTHSGMNSTMEALYFGVPLIGVPQQPEQDQNARRTEELGFGRRLDPAGITARTLRDAVAQVCADATIRQNLSRISHTLHTRDGAAMGADALEKYATRIVPAGWPASR